MSYIDFYENFKNSWNTTKNSLDKWITYDDEENMSDYFKKWVGSPLYSWVSASSGYVPTVSVVDDTDNKEEKHPKKDSVMDFNFNEVLTCEVRQEKAPGGYITNYYPYNKVVVTSKNNSENSTIDYIYKEEGLEETTVFTHNHKKGSISIDKILNVSFNGDTIHYFKDDEDSVVVM